MHSESISISEHLWRRKMEYIKKFRKNHSKNVLEKIEGKDELKSVEIGVVTKYIKD